MATIDIGEKMKKLKELHTRRQESRKLNHVEVAEEDRKNKLPRNWEARKRRQDWLVEEDDQRKACEEAGEDFDRHKALNMQADVADKIESSKRKKKNQDPGFSDFDAATLRQYQRLTKEIKPDMTSYNKMKETVGEEGFYASTSTLVAPSYPDQAGIDRLANEVEKTIEKRAQHSRRRLYDPDAPIDFINERNRKFNAKMDRFYSKYTEEIKESLERGTAV